MTEARTIAGSCMPRNVHLDNAQQEITVSADDDVRVVVPSLDAAAIDHVCSALLENARRLRRLPVARIITAIDRAARMVIDPAGPYRRDVLQSLEHVSGFSARMAEHVLDRIAQDWFASPLENLVRGQLGGTDIIERFTGNGHRVKAVAPLLGLHVLAGNVPGVGVTSVVRALLVRSAVIAKTASGEPTLTPLFARALSDADPEVGDCVAVTWWPGGNEPIEDAVLTHVGLVVHYGGADAITSLRARTHPRVKFIEHGPRISFAIVRADTAGPDAPAELASAVALFDQQGCVSPQVAYVIGSRDQAHAFAAATAGALGDIAADLPRGRLEPAEAAAIRDIRTRAEFAAIAGRDTELWAPSDLGFSVILSDDPALEASCLNRTILIKNVRSLADVLAAIEPFRDVLQTAGIDGFSGSDLDETAAALAEIGVTRITTLREMPWPPPDWHHDGRGGLTELISLVDLEL